MSKLIPINTSSFAEFNQEPFNLLVQYGFTPVLNPYRRNLKRHEVIELCSDAIGIIAGTEPLDAEILEKLPRLKVISRCGAGISNVDLVEAQRRGVQVCNTPDAPTQAVAELTLGLMLDMLRRISVMNDLLHRGDWTKCMGSLLSGKKIGIVGYGRIGVAVANLTRAFGCDVAYCDPFVAPLGTDTSLSLECLLKWADIVSLHVSSTETLIGNEQIRWMRTGSWLVNVSRGECVDEAALCAALADGHLAGAALDVYSREPYSGPLMEFDSVVMTPHIGSYARESRILMETESVRNLLIGLGIL